LVPSFSSEELAIGGLGSATSARLNAHILLGLSILLLSGSVNARPLDVDVASVRSGFNFGGLNNPVGGLGEQMYVSSSSHWFLSFFVAGTAVTLISLHFFIL
jgi:hypothetical protein